MPEKTRKKPGRKPNPETARGKGYRVRANKDERAILSRASAEVSKSIAAFIRDAAIKEALGQAFTPALAPEEIALITATARQLGQSSSEFVRQAAVATACSLGKK